MLSSSPPLLLRSVRIRSSCRRYHRLITSRTVDHAGFPTKLVWVLARFRGRWFWGGVGSAVVVVVAGCCCLRFILFFCRCRRRCASGSYPTAQDIPLIGGLQYWVCFGPQTQAMHIAAPLGKHAEIAYGFSPIIVAIADGILALGREDVAAAAYAAIEKREMCGIWTEVAAVVCVLIPRIAGGPVRKIHRRRRHFIEEQVQSKNFYTFPSILTAWAFNFRFNSWQRIHSATLPSTRSATTACKASFVAGGSGFTSISLTPGCKR